MKNKGISGILVQMRNFEFVELTKYLKKLLTPTLRNSLEYTYREEGKANDDSK